MLTLMLPAIEEFGAVEVRLEHSLASLSKWEAIHEKAFFSRESKTNEEMASYINLMVLNDEPIEHLITRLTPDDVQKIGDYINSKHSATWFSDQQQSDRHQGVVTAELIYYWMISFNIPFTCDTWHLNRLMALIRICSIKQSKPKPMSRQAQAEQYRALNAQRRAQLGTSG